MRQALWPATAARSLHAGHCLTVHGLYCMLSRTSSCRPSLAVRWTPGEPSAQRADCVSHEVELLPDGASPVRHSYPGRSRGCTLHAHLPHGTGSVSPACHLPCLMSLQYDWACPKAVLAACGLSDQHLKYGSMHLMAIWVTPVLRVCGIHDVWHARPVCRFVCGAWGAEAVGMENGARRCQSACRRASRQPRLPWLAPRPLLQLLCQHPQGPARHWPRRLPLQASAPDAARVCIMLSRAFLLTACYGYPARLWIMYLHAPAQLTASPFAVAHANPCNLLLIY